MRKLTKMAALAVVLLSPAPSWAAESDNCTPEQKAAGDAALKLTDARFKKSMQQNLPLGSPQGSDHAGHEQVLVQEGYVINYDEDLRVPLWTAHRLTPANFAKSLRINCFRTDPRLQADVASTKADYVEPVYDQGHMTPNGDMTYSITADVNTFLLSNMTPQTCFLNRGVWQIFETLVRSWATEYGTIYVMTGSVFDGNHNGKHDTNANIPRMHSKNGNRRVAIPSHLYKVLLRQTPDKNWESLTVLLPNDRTDLTGDDAVNYLGSHIVDLKKIEGVTGFTIFPDSGNSIQEAHALWPHAGFVGHTLVNAECRATPEKDP